MTNEDENPLARLAVLAGSPVNSCTASAGVQTWEDPYTPILRAPSGRPFLVAQLGQSLDGRIATLTGESQWINGSGALDHLHRLRALADAVIVGAGTVMADDPLLTVRRVPGKNPARVVIDPTGRIPANARCFACDGARRIVITAGDVRSADGVEVIALSRRDRKIDCKEITATLFRRGLKRLLIEGGPATVSAFIDAGIVDRLHLLVAPLILGSGKIGLELAPVARLAEARRPKARVYELSGGDVLFDCDMRQTRD
jgi:riboflavin-specific deaminase-like protein